MKKDTSKQMLFEMMHKVGGMPLKDNFEQDVEEFIPQGSYTVSNSGGYEVMLNDAGDAARVRDAYGSDNPQTSDWLEIEYIPSEDGESEPVIDPNGYNIPLNQVMRINGMNEENIESNKYNITTISEPIIPDAIQVVSQNSNAIEFTDKQSFDEFANQQQYFSASHSHCFYSVEEKQEWSRNGGKYSDPDSEQSVLVFETGHKPVQVWDNKNSIGYVVPSESLRNADEMR